MNVINKKREEVWTLKMKFKHLSSLGVEIWDDLKRKLPILLDNEIISIFQKYPVDLKWYQSFLNTHTYIYIYKGVAKNNENT